MKRSGNLSLRGGRILINWWSTGFGDAEIESIAEAIRSKNISQGKVTTLLEKWFANLLGAEYAVSSPNGTTAILIALHALGVRGGDEVLVPTLTAMGSANGIFGLGARPVFIDSQTSSPNLDPDRLEEKIGEKTRAILVMHHNGMSVDVNKVRCVARKFNLPVVEDAAQAMFSKSESGQYLGTLFQAGCFSFSVAKIISSGQGGMTVTNSYELYEKMNKLKIQDRNDYDTASFNMKFTDIQAAMLLPQLENIEARIKRLREIVDRYQERLNGLAEIEMVFTTNSTLELPLWAIAKCKSRDELFKFLEQNQVNALKWPRPLNEAKWFHDNGTYPRAQDWSYSGLRLPCGPTVKNEHIDRTIDLICTFYGYKS